MNQIQLNATKALSEMGDKSLKRDYGDFMLEHFETIKLGLMLLTKMEIKK